MGHRLCFQIIDIKLVHFVLATIFIIIILTASSVPEAPGQFKIDNDFLRKFLKDIKNPRILTIEDVSDEYEKTSYLKLGYSFVVEGDFNKDGYVDYAIAGKYDGSYGQKSLFVAIMSLKKGEVSLEFLHKISRPHDKLFISVESGNRLQCRNVNKKFDVIAVAMALWTDDVWAIVWDGEKYFRTSDCTY